MNTTYNQSDQAWLKKVSQDDRLGAFIFIGFGILALLIVNSGFTDTYETILNYKLPLNFIEKDFTFSHFIADGLLALFFLMAGLELKHAFTIGSLSKLNAAIVPIFAATFGMLFSGFIYYLLNFLTPSQQRVGQSQFQQMWLWQLQSFQSLYLRLPCLLGHFC